MALQDRNEVVVSRKKLNELKNKIINRGDLSYISVSEQLKYLDLLTEFSLGKFLINHQYFDAYWTKDLTTSFYKRKRSIYSNQIEDFIINHSLFVNAWREVYINFQDLLQAKLRENIAIASIPCGEMRDILTLDFRKIKKFKIYGVDISKEVIALIKELSFQTSFKNSIIPILGDAWNLPFNGELDIISSCGLNFYVDSYKKVQELYLEFNRALKPGGVLVTSFLIPPSWVSKNSEWRINDISVEHLKLERILFHDILELQCKNYCTSDEFRDSLIKAGFDNIYFFYDKYCIFPTVTAEKK